LPNNGFMVTFSFFINHLLSLACARGTRDTLVARDTLLNVSKYTLRFDLYIIFYCLKHVHLLW